MQVLFLSSGNSKYGINPIVSNQAESLVKAGIKVDSYLIKGKGIVGYFNNIKPLRRYLKENQYDIVHAHYGFSGIVALLARKKEKVIISFMGSDLLFNGNDKLISTLIFYSEVLINRLIAAFAYNYIIVKSDEMYKKLPYFVNKVVLPNGVNLERFQPVSMQIAKEFLELNHKHVILFASDPKRTEKNFALAQKAINKLETEEVELICLYGIDQSILKYYYSAASVLVMTSFHEGSPNVIKEALACNCPVVSTNVGDVSQLLSEVEGCYICSYDPDDVSDKIRKTLAFQGRTNGREKLIKMGLDQKIIAQRLIDIYSKLLH